MADAPPKPDYRPTVFLPKSDFPMKAGLPQKEPAILARWEQEDLYAQVRKSRAGRDKFILHDGPPYANGDIHIGHALNHVLKDMVVRTQTLLGKDAPYVPGWDCHGLPIEWKVEEQYRKKKLNKDEVPVREFRAECRAYAQHWVDVQREQLKRLGIGGDWDHPYLTMAYDAEATIVAELMKFAESGQLYRGAKPVMWSPVEKTALAEAEIEYEDIVSTQIDVAFEIVESPIQELKGAFAVIWTTTPWTIPVNQAIGYGPDVEYVLLKRSAVALGFEGDDQFNLDQTVGSVLDNGMDENTSAYFDAMDAKLARGLAETGLDRLPAWVLLAAPLVEQFNARVASRAAAYDWSKDGLSEVEVDYIETGDGIRVTGSELAGTVARHPMHKLGGFFARPRPFLAADFVTTDQGTGLVHEAPDHGEEDFYLCQEHGIDPVFAVTDDGRYRDDWLWLGGQGSVINTRFNAPDGPICSDLREAGALLAASQDFRHSYPHSWRSKAKVIYRCTPQWFIPMDRPLDVSTSRLGELDAALDTNGGKAQPFGSSSFERSREATVENPPTLRSTALAAIADTRFVPEKGRRRIGSMVEGRPDWVISRQRAWGVPIALFVERKTGELLVDRDVNERIVDTIREQGVDAWTQDNAAHFLGEGRNPDDYEMVGDILDVWFDSGCTHAFVLDSGKWPDLSWPADLYLEGSDQHRGWFQSSLLESCGTRGRAPYDAVLTHGFTMDPKGMKMSKSLGNVISPLDLMKEHGADILRLWALSVEFTEDHRIGKEILGGVADQYRKLRNTLRYLLGALAGFTEDERVGDIAAMPELERYMLHLASRLDGKLRDAVGDFDFNAYTRLLSDFANNDLSAFYFDIRKDVLYCDVNALTGVQSERRRAYRTVLDILFHALVRWLSPVLVFTTEEVWGARYPDDRSVHLLEWPEIPQALDPHLSARWDALRRSRDAVLAEIEPMRRDKVLGSSLEAVVHFPFAGLNISATQFAELCIVSEAVNDERAYIERTTNQKCGRCWRYLPEVAEDGALCERCEEYVNV